MSGAEPTHRLDPSARRSADGLLIVGGDPARLVRLSPAGRSMLNVALGAGGRAELGRSGQELLRRLEAIGVIHPTGDPGPPATGSITFVIPVLDGERWLARLVGELIRHGPVIVVDDGSQDRSIEVAQAAGARILANPGPHGPGAARNLGLERTATELVAFVDADCRPLPGWLDHLSRLFGDPGLALAAPRVRSAPGPGAIARYERHRSPLDLGPDPGLVGRERRISYVPSTALLARRAALESVGGFDPALRFGEDVDLCRRLTDAGWAVRFAPESEVEHEPRPSLRAFARQRHRYGASAVELERRHPRIAAPLRVARGTAATWAIGLAAVPVTALALRHRGRSGLAPALAAVVSAAGGIGIGAARACRRIEDPAARRLVFEAVVRGQLRAGRHLARAAIREWLPISVALGLRWPPTRDLVALAFLADAALPAHPRSGSDRHAGPAGRPAIALRAIDHASYCAGLWAAAARRGALGPLLPELVDPDRRRRRVSGA